MQYRSRSPSARPPGGDAKPARHPAGRRASPAIMLAACLAAVSAAGETLVTLVEDGKALLPVVVAARAQADVRTAATELADILGRISGATLVVRETDDPEPASPGIYLGTPDDGPLFAAPVSGILGPEEFVIRGDSGSLYLIAGAPMGVVHAVSVFLHGLGYRQFFPGAAWETLPAKPTIAGRWNERQAPDFRALRRIWYGFGAYPSNREDLARWNRRNRMGGPEPVRIGHTSSGLDFDRDFRENPEMFAEVDGRRRNSKPCFSHPEVIGRMSAVARAAAAAGDRSVSLSPRDGLGYCECKLCREVFQGGTPLRAHGTMFAERPDGVLVNITSETLFNAVRRAAEAVIEDYPDFRIGVYAYSAYSHPPSFDLPPNVYIQTTTAYRRTPLDLDEQIRQWGRRARHVGIRGYWSVYQWDWDNPQPGRVEPARLRAQLRFFAENNVTALNTEASNNWAPRGLGYYVGANLLWDVNADIDGLIRDFYVKAFGPAAAPMQNWFARWYGESVAVLETPEAALPDPDRAVWDRKDLPESRRTLAEGFADLDRAAILADDDAGRGYAIRVDQIRMYALYLYLRLKQWEASEAGDDAANLAAIRAETRFGGRLLPTNMIHARPLIGKAFHRRFREDRRVWEGVPELAEWGRGDRAGGEPPESGELRELWSGAMADLAAPRR